MHMGNRIERKIGVLLGTTLSALAVAACSSNYGRGSEDYCNGGSCRDGSPTVNRSGNILEKDRSCPEQLLEPTSYVTIAGAPITFFRTLYLRHVHAFSCQRHPKPNSNSNSRNLPFEFICK
ncbi:hypothetical protein COU88_04430 [Candidatus Roizmanbacteria bacterium CG10_big_fil_rev_8_21_14_0_10_39_6]|uniref:Lipoprotein n=1 Tax=Candidatus Roizmanbacteria bacterium CG10_big_fil_rev_8_21_14_0_10_39_6 TaxID=1974853 RepID=A0A2M8KRI6_9BACT|nr:MAG: hypothetical protein COU88_04430 [Candidatus Roizmanbacteria bacterium CG10_big_fil_rev_8_21_14_0_10_39_6]